MRKIPLMFIVLFMVAITILPLSASAASKADFRNVKWGMNTKQVKKLEKDKLIDSGSVNKFSYLTYNSSVSSTSAELSYLFYKNKLVRGIYEVKGNTFATAGDKINTYYGIKEALENKYGKPTNANDKYTINGAESSLRNDDGLDLMMGNILFKSRWLINNKKTEVTLYLDTYQGQPRLRILYTDRTNNLNVDKLLYSDGL
ncbi:hypothetical protein N6H13_11975 [Paenibacillus sp. CC-CFT742]|uniref:hypothetical protein n=1 Tax=Paenibacillus illinoisensis TaxID=59845 RepID=UPI00203DE72C|nr:MULTISPECIES: hypothetical protein [Paenibacillus]MCM3204139.1 hypothetical protein [Paenibacillus illinoisensis]WJH31207.1 hypothetical protein N6H13_11975 [Paenibacillus sp. CC-CFT742]